MTLHPPKRGEIGGITDTSPTKKGENPVIFDTPPTKKRDESRVTGEKRSAYGEFKNVMLSEKELEDLRARFPKDAQRRIDDLSYYIKAKGTKYQSHYGAILNWDRNNKARDKPDKGANELSSFDTDEFFEAALLRSEKRFLQGKRKCAVP